jgi:phosphoglycolate phosphatase
MSIRLAIFDCDGTLVDGQAHVWEAMKAGFAEASLPCPSRHEIVRGVGLSLPVAVRRLAPEGTLEQHAIAVETYKRTFFETRQAGRIHEPLFDGIAALLTRLHNKAWRLGVATGKSDRGLKNCLAIHGLTDLFCTLQTADRHPSKPHPSMIEEALADALARPENAVMIGDTTYDIEMAKAAGIRAIGVAWGYHDVDELLAAGALAVAHTTEELEELIHG